LDFSRPDPFASYFDRVVGTPQYVPQSVVVDRRPVAVYPNIWKTRPVGLDVAFAVFPKAARHPDPGFADHQFAHLSAHRFSVLIDNVCGHSRERPGECARLHRCEDITHHDATGVVNYRKLSASHTLEEPHPWVGIPRFAGGSKFAERRKIMSMHNLVAVTPQRANQRRRNTQRSHLMPIHQ